MSSPSPPDITTHDAANEVDIRGRLQSGTAVVLGFMGASVVAGLLFVSLSPRADANPRNAVPTLVAVGLLLGAGVAAQAMRVERLTIGDGEVVQEKSIGGVRWFHRRMARRGIERVGVQTRGHGARGVNIVGRDGRLRIGAGLGEADLDWLYRWVSARLP